MNIYQFSGRNVEITEALRNYVSSKLERLDRFNDAITDAKVVMTVRDTRDADRRNRIEVQLNVPGGIIRAEEHNADMYAAADKVVDVLERQLRKFKTKYLSRRTEEALPELDSVGLEEELNTGTPEIVRTKRFDMRPMTPEDAALQMEALGHDFYVFINQDTSQTAVVYRRRDGNYGLIEPNV
ncbi:ribosome hibernation-promoting factor, HPF/YfiA family [Deinobacterium chartae]|uniref:ribosome hibernation-promoting factor, HPF/YfiA family n=1 Tax=Deinobacterium chartae TaxID=521158 RepID=UPI001618D010